MSVRYYIIIILLCCCVWPKTTTYDEINNTSHWLYTQRPSSTSPSPLAETGFKPIHSSEVLLSIYVHVYNIILVSSLFGFNEHSRWCHGLADNICERSLVKVTIFFINIFLLFIIIRSSEIYMGTPPLHIVIIYNNN